MNSNITTPMVFLEYAAIREDSLTNSAGARLIQRGVNHKSLHIKKDDFSGSTVDFIYHCQLISSSASGEQGG